MASRPMRDMLETASRRTGAHMPGHGGKAPFPLPDLYRLDTTEIPATDDLYAPRNGIAMAQRLYAACCGAGETVFLHNGSTQGMHVMLEMGMHEGDTVILPRNAHLSAAQACILGGLRIVWVPVCRMGCYTYVREEDVLAAMRAHPEARNVLLTRPDYFGGCLKASAVRRIAQEAARAGIRLVVDEAHGAHLPFGGEIESAGALGADAWVQSVHKTMPALTGSAVLHLKKKEDLKPALQVLRREQTSSPSFLLMLSVDEARAWMEDNGREAMEKLRKHADFLRETGLRAGYTDPRDIWKTSGQVFDPCRVVFSAPQGGDTFLRELALRGIDAEMAMGSCVVLLLSPQIAEEDVQKIADALRDIPPRGTAHEEGIAVMEPLPERVMDVRKAALSDMEAVPLEKSAGRVAAACAGCYPPGIPLVVPGEVISEETVQRLLEAGDENRFGTEEGTIECAAV